MQGDSIHLPKDEWSSCSKLIAGREAGRPCGFQFYVRGTRCGTPSTPSVFFTYGVGPQQEPGTGNSHCGAGGVPRGAGWKLCQNSTNGHSAHPL